LGHILGDFFHKLIRPPCSRGNQFNKNQSFWRETIQLKLPRGNTKKCYKFKSSAKSCFYFCNLPPCTLAGFDLTTHGFTGWDVPTRPRRHRAKIWVAISRSHV
jgi:hypothetical protein